MKKITYLILLKTLLFAGFSFGQNPIPTPAFRFESDVYKFGKVQADSILSFFYTFQNTGNAPLVIADIKVECGCTQADWPDQPVAPGATDTIFVAFDTAGKWGFQ
ncbi:MAG: DUF1573 domain-containing protein, partial [Flavobacteriales bacterium]|nr:DUF1573 domain-containing protein [Flavobacteriales bacterium]